MRDHHALLRELSELAAQLAPCELSEPIVSRKLAAASGFSARRVVYEAAFTVERPLIVTILNGYKRVQRSGAPLIAEPGDVLILPPNLPFAMTSAPEAGGLFRSFIVEVDPLASTALHARHPSLCVHPQTGAFDPSRAHVLKANAAVLGSVLHFAHTLLVEGTHEALIQHRVEDLLLALSVQHAGDAGQGTRRPAGAAEPDWVLEVRKLVRQDPQAELSTDVVARRLAVSPATLRRRLAEAGVTLRSLRTEERMALARAWLAQPGAQVADVALRCGYRSPSKFARQFRRFAGEAPRRRAG
jgi:AraC-like DNA-binding protein